MFKFIKNIFFKPKRTQAELTEELLNTPGSGLIDDKDFGLIEYFQPDDLSDGIWQMNDQWEYSKYHNNLKFSSSSIPGNIDGPYEVSRNFLLSKNSSECIHEIFHMYDSELKKQINRFMPKCSGKSPKELLELSNINIEEVSSINDISWEATFEPIRGTAEKCVWIHIKFKNSEFVEVSTDT